MSNSPDRSRAAAIEELEALGLSTYAARTFVALVRLGTGTAQDVSNVAEVPRTRVYDAVEELRGRGIVDVQKSTPKQFWAISAETTGRHFQQEYAHRVRRLTDALDGMESASTASEQRGVWTVVGRRAVTARILDVLETADEEIVYMTVEDLLTPVIVDELQAASDRGVSIRLAEMAGAAEATLRDELPDAQTFESLWDWEDTSAGRLLMVDEEKTLVSVLVTGDGDHPPESRDETAIWGTGETNSLVVVLKAMFTWQLDDERGGPR